MQIEMTKNAMQKNANKCKKMQKKCKKMQPHNRCTYGAIPQPLFHNNGCRRSFQVTITLD